MFALRVLVPLFLACLLASDVGARPATPEARPGPGPSTCQNPRTRREWRDLSDNQKLDFIRAVKCLQTRRPRASPNPAVKTLYDELQETHINAAPAVHWVGQFLPWHRNFLMLYEQTLRESCFYYGPLPYWDWSRDADGPLPMSASPVFHPIFGFGGDGVPGTYVIPEDPEGISLILPQAYKGCVKDGPFASYTLHLGPGLMATDHCLVRGINETMKPFFTSARVANTISWPNFETFRVELEGLLPMVPGNQLHDGGHSLVGGEMANYLSSPADPLFYLHHANLDRVWWIWQQLGSPGRLSEISGPSSRDPGAPQVTLDTLLHFGTFGSSVPIRNVMDLSSTSACYKYVD